jgi:pectate lyase
MKKSAVVFLVVSLLAMMTISPVFAKNEVPLGREVLGKNNGWAAYGNGTTGGAAADENHVYTVSTKKQLLQALDNKSSVPKIIYIKGTIDMNTDETGKKMTKDDYADPEYDFEAYLEAYHPDKWGLDKKVSGPLEEARKRSQNNQSKNITVNIGSNTTIVGLGKDAKITGGAFVLDGVENVIIRNIHFEAPVDYFPQWDPTDGDYGEWNAEFDSLTITNNSKNIWIDHNTFSDGNHLDRDFGYYFGRLYQCHDGLLDIKNGSNYITVSYNKFKDHDKVSIIGSSDSRTSDRGHLKVTFHHNYYQNLTQRLPRVRFGEVHVYNNYYEFNKDAAYAFQYVWGVGVESKIYAQNNYFQFDWNADVSKIIKNWNGTSIYEEGSIVNRKGKSNKVDLVKEYNKSNSEKLDENVGWKPNLYKKIDPTKSVPAKVKAKAGAGKL